MSGSQKRRRVLERMMATKWAENVVYHGNSPCIKNHGAFHHVIRMHLFDGTMIFPFFTWLDFFSVPRAVSGGSH